MHDVDLLWIYCGLAVGVQYAVYDLIILYKMASADDMDNALLTCSSMYVASAAIIICKLVKNHD